MTVKHMSDQMDKTVEALRKEFQKVRTGGLPPPCSTKSGSTTTARPLRSTSWQPWLFPSLARSPCSHGKPKIIPAIEKAIMNANLGVTPSNDGRTIRLNLPPLTEERRKDIVKQLRKVAEDTKDRGPQHPSRYHR